MKLLLTALLFVGIFQLSTTTEVDAKSVDQLQKEKQEVNSKHKNVKSELDQAKSRLNNIKEKQKNTQSEINKLDSEASETQNQIDQKIKELEKKESEINTKQSEIDKLNSEINQLEERIDELQAEIKKLKEEIEVLKEEIKEQEASIEKREELLKNRLRSLQKNGGDIRYLEVILGSKDFGDFINRTVAVNKIMEQDNNILETHIQEKKDLEANKKKVESNKAQVEENKVQVEKDKETVTAQRNKVSEEKKALESQKASLTAEKNKLDNLFVQLEDQLGMKDTQLAKLEEQEEELHNHQMTLAEKEENLRAQAAAFDKLIAQKKAEEERKKQAASAKKSSGGNNGGSEGSKIEQTSNFSSGFIRPLDGGYMSSGYGKRSCSICSSNHPGVDFAKAGTVPIKASASGVVARSYYSSSYGNVVFISHIVNGQKYTTVYAHLRNRAVQTGQTVSQGQYIGNMGNTGNSTGQHLHFEIHRGEWNVNKSNAVNPTSFGIR